MNEMKCNKKLNQMQRHHGLQNVENMFFVISNNKMRCVVACIVFVHRFFIWKNVVIEWKFHKNIENEEGESLIHPPTHPQIVKSSVGCHYMTIQKLSIFYSIGWKSLIKSQSNLLRKSCAFIRGSTISSNHVSSNTRFIE